MAESLFAWACQSPLSKDDTLLLIGHLERVTVEANGSLDAVNLALLMALLYCFDITFLEQSAEDREGITFCVSPYARFTKIKIADNTQGQCFPAEVHYVLCFCMCGLYIFGFQKVASALSGISVRMVPFGEWKVLKNVLCYLKIVFMSWKCLIFLISSIYSYFQVFYESIPRDDDYIFRNMSSLTYI